MLKVVWIKNGKNMLLDCKIFVCLRVGFFVLKIIICFWVVSY